jgi:hypothetical protein
VKTGILKKPHISWFIPEPRFMGIRRYLGFQSWDPDISLPSVWIRSKQLTPYLNEKGFITSCNTPEPRPDVAIFLRRYQPEDVETAARLKSMGAKIVVDVVANYFTVREPSERGVGGSPRSLVKSFLRLIEMADQVWAVSPYLAEQSSKINSSTFFISDSVDPKHFNPQIHPRKSDKPLVTLGWSGAARKASELNEISGVLNRWIENKRVRVIIISRSRPELEFPFQFQRWNYRSFPGLIAQCDLCIAPRIVRNEYDFGHSLFKIGVFMAMGIPALAGAVPSYDLLLSDGLAGAICKSLDEWTNQLDRYILNDAARISAGRQALEKMRPYLTPVIATQVASHLNELLE